MVRKQAIAVAESVLEEVLQKAYADPDDTPAVVEAESHALGQRGRLQRQDRGRPPALPAQFRPIRYVLQ